MINISATLPYILLNTSTPGPSNFMSMYSGARYGLKGARGFIAGTLTGYSVKSVICALLAMMFAALLPNAMPYLKWIGFAYMMYLAVSIFCSSFRKGKDPSKNEQGSSSFKSGILLQCLNMKSWLSLLTLFSVYILPHTDAPIAVVLWGLISIASMTASTFLWVIFGQVVKRVYDRYKLAFNTVMALALGYCAVMALL